MSSQASDLNLDTPNLAPSTTNPNDESDNDEYLPEDDEEQSRPNRWPGPASTWQSHTALDRQTWRALENVRRGDLSVHLYNAYGVRRGLRRGPEVEEDEQVQVRSLLLSLLIVWWLREWWF